MTNKWQCYLLKWKNKNCKNILLFLFSEGQIHQIRYHQSIFILCLRFVETILRSTKHIFNFVVTIYPEWGISFATLKNCLYMHVLSKFISTNLYWLGIFLFKLYSEWIRKLNVIFALESAYRLQLCIDYTALLKLKVENVLKKSWSALYYKCISLAFHEVFLCRNNLITLIGLKFKKVTNPLLVRNSETSSEDLFVTSDLVI